jgi:alpha-galactosidase
MPYHLGIEWNILEASERDLAKLTAAITDHKRLRDVFHHGDVVRLAHPDPGVAAMAWLSVDRHHGVVSVAQLAMPAAAVDAPIRMPGLEPGRRYRVEPAGPRPHLGLQTRLPAWWTAGSIVLTGHQLAVHGVQLPVLNPESAVLLSLEVAR